MAWIIIDGQLVHTSQLSVGSAIPKAPLSDMERIEKLEQRVAELEKNTLTMDRLVERLRMILRY